MKRRSLKKNYKYGKVLTEQNILFKDDLHDRVGLARQFRNKNILDLGCGFGTDSMNFAKFARSVVGVDIDYYEEWKNFKNKKVNFVKADSSHLPFADNTFEGVYLKDLLHHLRDVEGTLSEIKRVAKPNGKIIVLEGNRFNPLFFFYVTKIRGHDHFTQREFKKLISNHFGNVKFISFEAYPPFCLPKNIYSRLILIERIVSNFSIAKPFFSYNAAIISNDKKKPRK